MKSSMYGIALLGVAFLFAVIWLISLDPLLNLMHFEDVAHWMEGNLPMAIGTPLFLIWFSLWFLWPLVPLYLGLGLYRLSLCTWRLVSA